MTDSNDTAKSVVMSFSPSFYAAMKEMADFDERILQLALLLPYSVDDVSAAFRRWAGPNPLPWRVALDYCIDRAKAGKSLPFKVEVSG